MEESIEWMANTVRYHRLKHALHLPPTFVRAVWSFSVPPIASPVAWGKGVSRTVDPTPTSAGVLLLAFTLLLSQGRHNSRHIGRLKCVESQNKKACIWQSPTAKCSSWCLKFICQVTEYVYSAERCSFLEAEKTVHNTNWYGSVQSTDQGEPIFLGLLDSLSKSIHNDRDHFWLHFQQASFKTQKARAVYL